MLRRLASWLFLLIIVLPLGVAAAAFALANRTIAAVALWPFGVVAELPLYLLSLGTLGLGLVVGALLVGFPAWGWRAAAGARARRIADLEAALEAEAAKRRQASAAALPAPDARQAA